MFSILSINKQTVCNLPFVPRLFSPEFNGIAGLNIRLQCHPHHALIRFRHLTQIDSPVVGLFSRIQIAVISAIVVSAGKTTPVEYLLQFLFL